MKRDQFLRELRKLANSENKHFVIFKDNGKGSHYRVTYDGRTTTVKSGELNPGYMRLIKKQLGIN